MEDLTGKQFGPYQIVEPLGEGGMAAVYKAFQASMERFVAVKVLPRHMVTSEEFVNRFKREARLLAQLQHPHILSVFDYGEAEGYPYIVMPFVKSGTLAEILHKQRLTLPDIGRIISQIGSALAYAHARGMIHRDVKPSNVLVDESGNCLLTDFGLARMTEGSIKITTSGAIMGTPAYMSPEQGTGAHIDQRTDVYALGIILYEMVTGRVPYIADTPIAVVVKHIQAPLPSARELNPDLPESIELVLLKVLAKNPDDRYQTADEFVHALQAAILEVTATSGAHTLPPGASLKPIVSTLSTAPAPATRAAVKEAGKTGSVAPWLIGGFILLLLLGGGIWGASFVWRQINQNAVIPATNESGTEFVADVTASPPVTTSTESPTASPTASPIPSPTEPPATIVDSRGVTMVLVPSGEFTMGGSIEAALAECVKLFPNDHPTYCLSEYFMDETPAHQVYLDSFYMDKFEVTNRLYQDCVEAGVCKPPSNPASATHNAYYSAAEFAEYPVIWVDWNMARAYCEWRDARLPTEAEWEKSARGTSTQIYPWGNSFEAARTNSCDLNCPKTFADKNLDDDFAELAPVTAFPEGVSSYGVFNLSGNVSEWVADLYSDTYYATVGDNAANPPGPQTGEEYSYRGGSWARFPINLRLVTRSKNAPEFSANDLGFRCASPIP